VQKISTMKKEQEKENVKVDSVRQKIMALRSKKSYTFENMAHELNITPSLCCRANPSRGNVPDNNQ
jgi:hypothetical protein